MFLSLQHKTLLSRVSIKLAAIYSVGLIISSILVFTLVYFQVLYSFEAQGRKELTKKLNELIDKIEFIDLNAEQFDTQKFFTVNSESTIFYYFSAQGDVLLSQEMDSLLHVSKAALDSLMDEATESLSFHKVDNIINGNNEILIVTKKLKGGEKLIVGQSISGITGEISSLRKVFFWFLIPIVIFGFLIGFYLSSRLMRPLQEIINVFKAVEQGSFTMRVPITSKNDELGELKLLSNGVLDQVEIAISNLSEAFDHLAHDIRTPVTRLRGRAELTLSGEGSIESYREALQSCYENSDRILKFLDTLTQISEAENRALKLKLQRVSLGELVAEIMELYEIAFEEKNISVKKILLKADIVECDQHLIKRVIANLLDNAHKYTPENGEVFIETYKTDKHVVLSIRDSGMGIPRGELSLVWNRLFRGDKSRTAYGMGLGLTFVKAVVEAHGGTVNVLSPVADGGGTEFLVKLKQPTNKQ